VVVEETKTEEKVQEKEETPKVSETAEGPSTLILTQDELRGELRSLGVSPNEQGLRVVQDKVKEVMQKLDEVKVSNRRSTNSLKYLIDLSTDFSQMLRFI